TTDAGTSCANAGATTPDSRAVASHIFRPKAEATQIIAPEYTAAPWRMRKDGRRKTEDGRLEEKTKRSSLFRLPSFVFPRWSCQPQRLGQPRGAEGHRPSMWIPCGRNHWGTTGCSDP